MARQTTVETLPRTVSVAGGRDEERRIEGEHRLIQGKPTSNPPAGYHRGGGARQKGENQHELERWHNPESREGGKYHAENT